MSRFGLRLRMLSRMEPAQLTEGLSAVYTALDSLGVADDVSAASPDGEYTVWLVVDSVDLRSALDEGLAVLVRVCVAAGYPDLPGRLREVSIEPDFSLALGQPSTPLVQAG